MRIINLNTALQGLVVVFLLSAFYSCASKKTLQNNSTHIPRVNKIQSPETINPKIIWTFLPWVSDNRPSISAIDVLEASDSNQFYVDILNKEDKIGFIEDGQTFYYSYIGQTENGALVYKTYNTTGGTSISIDALVLSQQHKFLQVNSSKREQLLLSLDAYFCLGVNNDADIKIEGNTVIIPQSCNSKNAIIYDIK